MAEWMGSLLPDAGSAAQIFGALFFAVLLVRFLRFVLSMLGLGR